MTLLTPPPPRCSLCSPASFSPTGRTPICARIREIVDDVRRSEAYLRQTGRKALIVIATDGVSTDGDVRRALEPLQNLPAWVVIRLCTNEDEVVDYWNQIDDDLELDMDVLDDLKGEAAEINELNPWMNYSQEIHRVREFGACDKLFDLIDERAFKLNEVFRFIKLLFGEAASNLTNPSVDPSKFVDDIKKIQKKLGQTYNPLKNRVDDWINVSKIKDMVGKGGNCVIS